MNWIIKFLNKYAVKNYDFVDLSVGRVYMKPLTYGILNKARVKSCIVEDVINNPLFFQLVEYELFNVSKKFIDNLSVSDGELLRSKTNAELLKVGAVKLESKNEEFSSSDVEMLNKMKAEGKEALKHLREVKA